MYYMSHKDLSDEQLMLRITQGDKDALSVLYDRHAAVVLGVVMRIVHERTVAEDVLQETFWRVWDKADSFDSVQGKFTTWMFSIARRHAIDVYRKQKIRPNAAENENVLLVMERQADDTNVEQAVATRLDKTVLHGRLSALSDVQREVLEMAYFQGKTRRQIAAETDIPLGTINTRVRLALQNLAKLIKNEGGSS